jgi:hypothetical protein
MTENCRKKMAMSLVMIDAGEFLALLANGSRRNPLAAQRLSQGLLVRGRTLAGDFLS